MSSTAGNSPQLDSGDLPDPTIFNGPDAHCVDIEYGGISMQQLEVTTEASI